MAVVLESTVKRYVGRSSDAKPQSVSAAAAADGIAVAIPVSSTFYELDTGRTSKYDGANWAYTPLDQVEPAMLAVLSEVLEVMQEIRDEVRATRIGVQTQISAGDSVQDDLLDLSLEIRDQKNEEN